MGPRTPGDPRHGTLGPRVDAALRTSRPGVFAAGNLLHPVDTADTSPPLTVATCGRGRCSSGWPAPRTAGPALEVVRPSRRCLGGPAADPPAAAAGPWPPAAVDPPKRAPGSRW
ncbi:hypothetical protein GCM10020218_097300 [Dactylosporangium vinaceum]